MSSSSSYLSTLLLLLLVATAAANGTKNADDAGQNSRMKNPGFDDDDAGQNSRTKRVAVVGGDDDAAMAQNSRTQNVAFDDAVQNSRTQRVALDSAAAMAQAQNSRTKNVDDAAQSSRIKRVARVAGGDAAAAMVAQGQNSRTKNVAFDDAAQSSRTTCKQEIPAELIRELWTRTNTLRDRLPAEKSFCRRLLPKFCTKCPERQIGWLEMRDLFNIYQKNVFSRESVQKLLPLHYNDLLYRVQHTLMHCVSSSERSRWSKVLKKLERKVRKKRRDEVALKAVGEFTFVLRWIDELAQHHVL